MFLIAFTGGAALVVPTVVIVFNLSQVQSNVEKKRCYRFRGCYSLFCVLALGFKGQEHGDFSCYGYVYCCASCILWALILNAVKVPAIV